MILELQQPLPLETPKGKAYAFFVIDYGTEHHLMWVCFLRETGDCWTFPNPEIRLEPNATMRMRSTTVDDYLKARVGGKS